MTENHNEREEALLKEIFSAYVDHNFFLLADRGNKRARAISAFIACVAKECRKTRIRFSFVSLEMAQYFRHCFTRARIANKRRYIRSMPFALFTTTSLNVSVPGSGDSILPVHTPKNPFFSPHFRRTCTFISVSRRNSAVTFGRVEIHFGKRFVIEGYKVDCQFDGFRQSTQTFYVLCTPKNASLFVRISYVTPYTLIATELKLN